MTKEESKDAFEEFIIQLKKDVLILNDSYRDIYIRRIESLYPTLKSIDSSVKINDDSKLTSNQKLFLAAIHYQFKFRKAPLDFAFCLTVNEIINNDLNFS